jgi:hypothetical protein
MGFVQSILLTDYLLVDLDVVIETAKLNADHSGEVHADFD